MRRRREFKAAGPVLVVVPGASVDFWAGEWALWGAPGTSVVPYAGSAAARAVIQDHELWLAPSSLDGKAMPHVRKLLTSKVRGRRGGVELPAALLLVEKVPSET